jgi:hypothetical protein
MISLQFAMGSYQHIITDYLLPNSDFLLNQDNWLTTANCKLFLIFALQKINPTWRIKR